MLHWSQLKGFSPAKDGGDHESQKQFVSAFTPTHAEGLKLTAVDLLVPLEQIFLDEAHVTLTAPERPLTCAIKSTTIRSPH